MMDQSSILRLQSDWYSPTRLHDSPVEYDFPGDRFIPNRSLMSLDQAQSVLTNKCTEPSKRKFGIEYRKKLEANLTLDVEGRPFQMLVFRGSPKARRKLTHHIDEMRRSDEQMNDIKQHRQFPKKASRVLDAPNLKDDFYTNIMDWGKTNILCVALGSAIYLWNAESHEIKSFPALDGQRNYFTSLAWSEDGKTLAAGENRSRIQIWDAEISKPVRGLTGHVERVGTIAWNGHILTSGGQDRLIVNHDVRARKSLTSCMKMHKGEVCGLKWSSTGNILASGGNDNVVYIWDATKMSEVHYVHRLNEHTAAVRALAWCPYKFDVLASGGGTSDGSLKLWNIQKGTCINSIETGSQICGLQWNRHHKEILSCHGYGYKLQNQLCLWKYPSMSVIGERMEHDSRVLHITQSPDGLTVASAGADQTIRFWEVFGPPVKSSISNLDSLLSLKTTPIR